MPPIAHLYGENQPDRGRQERASGVREALAMVAELHYRLLCINAGANYAFGIAHSIRQAFLVGCAGKATTRSNLKSAKKADFMRFKRLGGVTLVELLVVMGILVIVMSLIGPAMNALKGASDVTKAVFDIAGTLENARAYAIANNTYVLVGFQELDASKDNSVSPQPPATPTSGGRVAVAIVASRDGTLGGLNINNISSVAWTANYNKGARLTTVGPIQVFESLHLADSLGNPPATGNMARPSIDPTERISSSGYRNASSGGSYNTFSWPLGTDFESGKYNFKKVLTFDPQGTPHNVYKSFLEIQRYFEIGLQQTHGSTIPKQPADPNVGNHVAIVINGTTGQNRIYRP